MSNCAEGTHAMHWNRPLLLLRLSHVNSVRSLTRVFHHNHHARPIAETWTKRWKDFTRPAAQPWGRLCPSVLASWVRCRPRRSFCARTGCPTWVSGVCRAVGMTQLSTRRSVLLFVGLRCHFCCCWFKQYFIQKHINNTKNVAQKCNKQSLYWYLLFLYFVYFICPKLGNSHPWENQIAFSSGKASGDSCVAQPN